MFALLPFSLFRKKFMTQWSVLSIIIVSLFPSLTHPLSQDYFCCYPIISYLFLLHNKILPSQLYCFMLLLEKHFWRSILSLAIIFKAWWYKSHTHRRLFLSVMMLSSVTTTTNKILWIFELEEKEMTIIMCSFSILRYIRSIT